MDQILWIQRTMYVSPNGIAPEKSKWEMASVLSDDDKFSLKLTAMATKKIQEKRVIRAWSTKRHWNTSKAFGFPWPQNKMILLFCKNKQNIVKASRNNSS